MRFARSQLLTLAFAAPIACGAPGAAQPSVTPVATAVATTVASAVEPPAPIRPLRYFARDGHWTFGDDRLAGTERGSDPKMVKRLLKQGPTAFQIETKDLCSMKHTLERERERVTVNVSYEPPILDATVAACLREIRPLALGIDRWTPDEDGDPRAAKIPSAVLDVLTHLSGVEALAIRRPTSVIAKLLGDRASSPDGASLQSLSLITARFTPEDFAHIAKRTNLRSLRLLAVEHPPEGARSGLAALARLTRLEYLDLDSCASVTDEDLGAFAALPALRTLRLDQIWIHDEGVAKLADLDLEVVSLGATKITDASMKVIRGWPHLRDLELWLTSLTDVGLREIAEIKTLNRLILYGTSLTEASLEPLATLPELSELYLPRTISTAAVDRFETAHPKILVQHEGGKWRRRRKQ